MFEIESKTPDEITIITKKTTIKFNIADAIIDAGLAVGKISGPGEFEIGDATIRGIATESGKTIYDVEVGGVHTGIIGGIEENLDDIVADILCTSSVRAIREIEPKLISTRASSRASALILSRVPSLEPSSTNKNS